MCYYTQSNVIAVSLFSISQLNYPNWIRSYVYTIGNPHRNGQEVDQPCNLFHILRTENDWLEPSTNCERI